MIYNYIVVVLSAMSATSLVLAAPATYNQRQDGALNVAAKLDNIMVVIALPSSGPKFQLEDDKVPDYMSLLTEQSQSGPTKYDVNAETTNAADTKEPSKVDQSGNNQDEDDAFELFAEEENLKEELQRSPQESSDKVKVGETISYRVFPKSRTLWSQVEDVGDNIQSGSLKKELSWGQDADAVAAIGEVDDQGRASERNEVGLVPSHHLTLIGTAIEDCGPDRKRNSYGICQAQPVE